MHLTDLCYTRTVHDVTEHYACGVPTHPILYSSSNNRDLGVASRPLGIVQGKNNYKTLCDHVINVNNQ